MLERRQNILQGQKSVADLPTSHEEACSQMLHLAESQNHFRFTIAVIFFIQDSSRRVSAHNERAVWHQPRLLQKQGRLRHDHGVFRVKLLDAAHQHRFAERGFIWVCGRDLERKGGAACGAAAYVFCSQTSLGCFREFDVALVQGVEAARVDNHRGLGNEVGIRDAFFFAVRRQKKNARNCWCFAGQKRFERVRVRDKVLGHNLGVLKSVVPISAKVTAGGK
mmetsp:Transcript_42899/g.84572  ORF Transcript_42899/g.84572 Transcript_42899/m.84572 type:complete len:222 (+) Transcript_42899:294-959(+)